MSVIDNLNTVLRYNWNDFSDFLRYCRHSVEVRRANLQPPDMVKYCEGALFQKSLKSADFRISYCKNKMWATGRFLDREYVGLVAA